MTNIARHSFKASIKLLIDDYILHASSILMARQHQACSSPRPNFKQSQYHDSARTYYQSRYATASFAYMIRNYFLRLMAARGV